METTRARGAGREDAAVPVPLRIAPTPHDVRHLRTEQHRPGHDLADDTHPPVVGRPQGPDEELPMSVIPFPLRGPDIEVPAAPDPTVTDVTGLGTVLGVWAHPDDEAFLAGGLMAAARDAGQRVVCVTATLGEHGTADPFAWPPDRMARVRRHELDASMAVLGVDEHHTLGITDGTCAAQPHDALVRHLGRVIDIVAPDTIVTFGPDGLTGHEDHQTVSSWVTAARAAVAPRTRLLYVTTTDEFVDGWEPARDAFDVFLADGLPLRTPESALAVQLRLDDATLDRKVVALRAQASQMSGLIAAVGEERARQWWSVEAFVSADAVAGSARTWGTWRVAA